MCRLIVLVSVLYHASLNSRACFVCAHPSSWVSVQLELWQLSYVCAAGSDKWSCRFMAFLCSVIRVSIFFEV